ncbi:hypothetical protein BS50DRAFT_635696 [Corynespora cassiicola Philippines]|uniref:Uncharacterized protein n=1 Tax=Corynespora cassiicola Philippines TaxID=1448308 RepID=A0A2T2NIH4_CORCC|nr:hypothetical protein BS50DRAFT_635696 [Corynespora cassiicola Philippines]
MATTSTHGFWSGAGPNKNRLLQAIGVENEKQKACYGEEIAKGEIADSLAKTTTNLEKIAEETMSFLRSQDDYESHEAMLLSWRDLLARAYREVPLDALEGQAIGYEETAKKLEEILEKENEIGWELYQLVSIDIRGEKVRPWYFWKRPDHRATWTIFLVYMALNWGVDLKTIATRGDQEIERNFSMDLLQQAVDLKEIDQENKYLGVRYKLLVTGLYHYLEGLIRQ